MLTATPYPVKMFEYITADIKTALGLSVLHYEYGHPLEILKTLQTMTEDPASQASKFPLLALFLDFDEERGMNPGIYKAKFHLIIATLTEQSYLAPDRLTNTFIATLYPIYSQLLTSIFKSGYFRLKNAGDIEHTKTDRFYWGKSGLYGNEGNVFNDFIDAIEIQNLSLIINNTVRCQ